MHSVYVHIPFCDYKCTFCDFATYIGQDRYHDDYVQAVLRELQMRAPLLEGQRTSTVFFGGGTPTVLDPSLLQRLLQAIDQVMPIESHAEISAESNPDNLTAKALAALRAAGINRLSIGVQTLNDAVLQQLNRRHSAKQALAALHAAREAGFNSINADLIFGLPGQSPADWDATLSAVLACQPDHLSLYGLLVEQGALLKHQIEHDVVTLPDDDDAAIHV